MIKHLSQFPFEAMDQSIQSQLQKSYKSSQFVLKTCSIWSFTKILMAWTIRKLFNGLHLWQMAFQRCLTLFILSKSFKSMNSTNLQWVLQFAMFLKLLFLLKLPLSSLQILNEFAIDAQFPIPLQIGSSFLDLFWKSQLPTLSPPSSPSSKS